MCRRVVCPVCHLPTFAGCGRHVEQVLADVPPAKRCSCRARSQEKPAVDGVSSILKRFFSR